MLGEIELQKKEKKVHNQRISKVLENLSENYEQEFPFLLYYRDFAEEFEKIRTFAEIPKNYEVELLKKIAEELMYQVQWANDDFLKYWVTKRYSGEITYYFASACRSQLLEMHDDPHVPFKKSMDYRIMDYQMTNLRVMAEYLKCEHDSINSMYEELLYSDLNLNFNLHTYF